MKLPLITGHLGFIGSRLHQRLGDAIGIDLREGMNLLTCGFGLESDVNVIYHLAAQSSVEGSWNDPVHDADNLRLMVRLVENFPYTKIIHTHSCAGITPKSPYGFSKKAASDYMKTFQKNYVNLVLPNIYGEDSHSVVDIFKNTEDVTIFGDGKQIRDYVHVDDIVSALIKAKDWPTGEYFLGSGIGTSVLDLAKGKNVRFEEPRKEEREVVLPNTTPDWKPTINVHDYLNA